MPSSSDTTVDAAEVAAANLGEADDPEASDAKTRMPKVGPDYVLEESQHILVDYLGLLAKRKTLTASNPASRN